jgi:hypothetical protein
LLQTLLVSHEILRDALTEFKDEIYLGSLDELRLHQFPDVTGNQGYVCSVKVERKFPELELGEIQSVVDK